jgi:hypothetical protein
MLGCCCKESLLRRNGEHAVKYLNVKGAVDVPGELVQRSPAR